MAILDVRTKEEWDVGHVDGALHVPVEDIINQKIGTIAQLPKEEKIQIYCKTGNRSGIAVSILNAMGYVSVTNEGGLARMIEMGHKQVIG